MTCLALASPPAAAQITVPPGIRSEIVARGVALPTNLAFDPAGGLWIASSAPKPAATDGIWYVRSPGSAPRHVVTGLAGALGLTWYRGELYAAHVAAPGRGRVSAYGGFDGRRFSRQRVVVDKLPVGEHTVDTIVPGPDDRLYLGVGSEFDARPSRGALAGTVVSFSAGGRDLKVVGSGFRNPYGLAFFPGTASLLVTDNARDDLGLHRPPEELNLVDTTQRPRPHGFPACYGQGGSPCAGTVPPIANLAPHASADGLAVADRFGDYGPSAFVAENGSSFAANPSGSDVIRVGLKRRGAQVIATGAQVFATRFARHDPLGAAIGPDEALYVTLYRSGQVIRFVPPYTRRDLVLAVVVLRVLSKAVADEGGPGRALPAVVAATVTDAVRQSAG